MIHAYLPALLPVNAIIDYCIEAPQAGARAPTGLPQAYVRQECKFLMSLLNEIKKYQKVQFITYQVSRE